MQLTNFFSFDRKLVYYFISDKINFSINYNINNLFMKAIKLLINTCEKVSTNEIYIINYKINDLK